MSWLEVLVLGVVQGLTEFLPISSSAHLRVVSALFFGHDAGAAFTAVVQLGTEAAVLVYFARDIARLIRTGLRGLWTPEVRTTPDFRVAWLVVLGTIPIAVLGFVFEDAIQTIARNLWLIAGTLIGFGLLLGLAERVGRQRRPVERMSVGDGIVMGFAQAMALVPGVSRSGGTITAGLFLGLTRPAAVRYSFLLAIPAVIGAGLFQLPDVFAPGARNPTVAQMGVSTLLAFVVGYASIAWLLRYVERHSVYVFVWYRVALGLAIIGLLLAGTLTAM